MPAAFKSGAVSSKMRPLESAIVITANPEKTTSYRKERRFRYFSGCA
jgi:hypothetical protein